MCAPMQLLLRQLSQPLALASTLYTLQIHALRVLNHGLYRNSYSFPLLHTLFFVKAKFHEHNTFIAYTILCES